MNTRRELDVTILADGLALAYHEARNVRVLGDFVDLEEWKPLLDRLGTNRLEAWKQIQPTRTSAGKASTAFGALIQFEQVFQKSLIDLADLFANPNWRHASAWGGHAWREVVSILAALAEAIESQCEQTAFLVNELIAARHNNGELRAKIVELDSAIGVDTPDRWNE
ncbi:MAG: hypothetical protein ABR507_10360 [Actinomycetota bacterium]|nr:hypothetical protein [Actinomycetota bacterium]